MRFEIERAAWQQKQSIYNEYLSLQFTTQK